MDGEFQSGIIASREDDIKSLSPAWSSSLDSNNPEVGTLGHILVTVDPLVFFYLLPFYY